MADEDLQRLLSALVALRLAPDQRPRRQHAQRESHVRCILGLSRNIIPEQRQKKTCGTDGQRG